MIPLILGAVALGTAAFGVGTGISGVASMNEANEIGKRAQEKYERVLKKLEADWEATNKAAEVYGQMQLHLKLQTIGRFVDFIKRNIGQRASQDDLKFLLGIGISVQLIEEYKAVAIEAEQFFQGAPSAVIAGTAAGQGAMTLATSVGVASTGTAISGLSGAAAWNATLAWLGGGSLAAGGGGMALGTVVLGGITVAPALAVGGFMLAGEGEKALTNAREYEAKVNTEVAKIEAARDFLKQIKRRITELVDLACNLNNRATVALNELESQAFDHNKDADKFQMVALLVKALAEILKTPVLNSEGKINLGTVTIFEKYGYLRGN